ncbi:MAG TPA: hypothetical protein VEU30_05285, partial [Thermoanaerobaculia bacterium]|nr:hypothetical protein [Thermoanaerobaculia bacterium]
GNNLYQATWTIPADATDDTVFTIRAVATNQGNKTSDVSARLTIVSGTVITADATVTDNRYDDQTVIVKSGTLTLGGARRFARFIVLENARVTHLAATSAGERVEIEAETLYISCDAGLDTTGKGYGTNRTVGDVAAGASTGHSAGSHGGRGAHNNGVANAEYGSLTDPSHPGAGGASPGACGLRCYAGGGVVRFKGTNAIVDGFLAAHGVWHFGDRNGGAGAGGSIKVEASNVAGYGEIRADGGYSEGLAGGGGGRVAIVYDQLSIPRANISARGASGYWGHLHGAPGTVYLRGNGGTEVLTADNNNLAPQQSTSIQDLGSGTVTSVNGATLTLSNPVPEWIAGSYLELLDANGDVTAAYRITARTATTVTVANEGAVIAPGTAYRGAWRFTEVVSSGRASLLMGGVTVPTLTVVSPSFMSLTEVRGSAVTLRGGSFDLARAKVGNLTLTGNASVSHPHANPDARRMTLDVANTLTIDAGSFLDASARGLGSNRTYPNTTTGASTGHSGGSHGGRGAAVSGTTANEFGSLFDPDTPGGGGSNPPNCERCAAGGGVLRIKAANVVVNGKILSVGGWDWTNRQGGAGAGGSIRIDAPVISGSGEIRADGGYSEGLGGGGGGRVALYFNQLTVPRANISARGGSGYYGHQHGGAGTLYLRGPAGDQLVVDNQGLTPSQVTRLADLGSGTITAVNGAELTLSAAPPEWVVGSYLELLNPAGNVIAAYEITARSATGVTVRTNGDTIAAGTAYRGAWKFGEVVTAGLAILQMQGVSTPLLTAATSGYMLLDDLRGTDVTLQGGTFVLRHAKVNNLTIANGAALTQHATDATTIRRLTLDVAGTLTVNAGASIDVSGRGYGSMRTWDATTGGPTTTGGSTGHAGGTHAGRGASVSGTAANEFGSLFDPDTPGGGGGRLSDNCHACNAGGGILRIKAGNAVVNGRIYAIGAWDWTSRTGGAGAGGSIRIDAATISGSGEIRADGAYSEGLGGGGGGRLALYYDDLTVPLPNISARGGSGYYGHQHGAAGTVYLKESGAPDYLLFHNGNLNPQQPSRLAELGTGTVTAASGSVLTLSNPVPDWLAGSWIELLDASGNVAAAYEIASRTATTVTLRNGGEAVAAGTAYRGAWRFGELAATNHAYLRTAAVYETPLLTTAVNGWMTIGDLRGTDVTMKGVLFELTNVKTSTLTVTGGAMLSHPVPDLTSIRKLTIDTGTLTIDAGAGIEVSGRGFASLRTWNNVTAGGSTGHSGGSHGGMGAYHTGVSGPTFGSLYDPDTPGGGGGRTSDNCERCNAGGGVVRIKAGNAVINGKIYSYGAWDWTSRTGGAGAGGSIRIDAATISGSGEIRADGAYSEGLGGGGGGRVALYYDNLTVPLANITARGGSGYYGHQHGAAGTVYLKPSAQTFGELRVINDLATSRGTRLTSVGARIADEVGTSTLRDADASFPGPNHLAGIRVFAGSDRAKRWLVTGNTADTVTLDVGVDPLVATVGGPFRGIQKFEKIVLRNAYLEIEDVLEYVAAIDNDGVSTVTGSNEAAPLVDASKISLQVTATGSAIVAAAGAVADPDQPVKVFVTNTATGLTTTHTAGATGSVAAAVQGNAGD